MILQMTLLLFTAAAACRDFCSYHIPNALIVAGAANGCLLRCYAEGMTGLADAVAGALWMLILCGGLFALSMLGAGDLKLLLAVALYMGPVKVVRLWVAAMVLAAVFSFFKMLRYGNFKERLYYLADYLRVGIHKPGKAYLDMSHLQGSSHYVIPFAVPVFLAVVMNVCFF